SLEEAEGRGGEGVSQRRSKRVHSPSWKGGKRQRRNGANEVTDRVRGVMTRSAARAASRRAQNKIDHPAKRTRLAKLSLISLSGVPLTRVLSLLLAKRECFDLTNLAMVSRDMYKEVVGFTMLKKNRPGIGRVILQQKEEELEVTMLLFPINLPFYGLANLDRGQFKLSSLPDYRLLKVTLRSPEDPILSQVENLLCTYLDSVDIGCRLVNPTNLSTANLSFCIHLLRKSTIRDLRLEMEILDDNTSSFVNSIASRVKEFHLTLFRGTQLSNPTAFIINLYSMPIITYHLNDSSSPSLFFGLPHIFWQNFLNQKLSNRSLQWLRAGILSNVVRKAPIALPNSPIEYIDLQKWEYPLSVIRL
ncbi:hypothetical protein PMAYCL1PPCAC_27188, partial [Pristionchus mayeri]